MPSWHVKEIASIVNGNILESVEGTVSHITLDSRQAHEQSLFVPLKGRYVDGHEFIAPALAQGAAVLARCDYPSDGLEINDLAKIIRVDDPLQGLQKLGKHQLQRVNPVIVAITGSVGKTTTKELIASVLQDSYNTFYSAGNLNTEQGMPLALCGIEDHHQVAVLEMAMRGKGQIRHLTSLAPPDIAVITNIGVTHLEALGSQENIVEAKAEILEGLNPNGVAVLNGDNVWCRQLGEGHSGKVIYFGIQSQNDIYPQCLTQDQQGRYSFVVSLGGRKQLIKLPVAGQHQVYNALASIAVGQVLDVSPDMLARGIGCYKTISNRQHIIRCEEIIIVDDTYNAGPDSIPTGVEQLHYLQTPKRRIVVVGDMLELGHLAIPLHREVGQKIVNYNVDLLICRGQLAEHYGIGAMDAGFDARNIIYTKSNEETSAVLLDILQDGDAVLIKGSRGLQMESIVEKLIEVYCRG